MFWDNFLSLCSRDGLSPNAVAAELGKSSGSVTAWKNGTVPRETTLRKIADYFGVSVDLLIGREENKTPPAKAEGVSKRRLVMIEQINALTLEEFSEKASAIEAILNIKL